MYNKQINIINDDPNLFEKSLLLKFNENKSVILNYHIEGDDRFISNVVCSHSAAVNVVEKYYSINNSPLYEKNIINKYSKEFQTNVPALFTTVDIESHVEKIDKDMSVIVTSCVNNAISTGKDDLEKYRLGTINIITNVNYKLSKTAQLQLMMIITEAKAGVLRDLQIKSAYSDNIATGTGTDTICVISNIKGKEENYVGGHSLIGNKLGRLVRAALLESLK